MLFQLWRPEKVQSWHVPGLSAAHVCACSGSSVTQATKYTHIHAHARTCKTAATYNHWNTKVLLRHCFIVKVISLNHIRLGWIVGLKQATKDEKVQQHVKFVFDLSFKVTLIKSFFLSMTQFKCVRRALSRPHPNWIHSFCGLLPTINKVCLVRNPPSLSFVALTKQAFLSLSWLSSPPPSLPAPSVATPWSSSLLPLVIGQPLTACADDGYQRSCGEASPTLKKNNNNCRVVTMLISVQVVIFNTFQSCNNVPCHEFVTRIQLIWIRSCRGSQIYKQVVSF